MKGKLTINIKVTEQEFMEGLLNQYCSGQSFNSIMFTMSMVAFAEGWHINKLTNYIHEFDWAYQFQTLQEKEGKK